MPNPEARPVYFMCRVHGGRPPGVKHMTLAIAMTEATRLATVTGKITTVLASYAAVYIEDGKPVWTDTNAIGTIK